MLPKNDLQERLLGAGHEGALAGFEDAVREWAVPFLRAWMNSGIQPRPSNEDLKEILAALTNCPALPPSGYSWLPELLQRLSEGLRFNSRNFVNIHPSPHVPAVLASAVVALQNPNNIVEEVSRPTTAMEHEVISWMAENLVGFTPDQAWGNVVSGGTIANMSALLVARDYCYGKLSRPRHAEVRTRGLFGLPAGVVFATKGSHYSIKKALWFLGMGDENVITIPVAFDEEVALRVERDENFIRGITRPEWRDRIEEWLILDRRRGGEELTKFYSGESSPFSLQPLNSEIFKSLYACFEYGTPLVAYVFTLGTTDTGTIERPDSEALRILKNEDVFIHADAAAGGFALMHSRVKALVQGLSRVHSVTIDGHKLGHLAYPNGAVLFREKGWMNEILHEAPYLRHLAPTLEGSRPGSHVAALWAAIKDLGDTGRYEHWLDLLFAFTDALVEAFNLGGKFQVLHQVDLTTIAVAPLAKGNETRRHLNAITRKVHHKISQDTSPEAFLVNLDEGLSGIKVRDLPGDPSSDLVDITCLRLVVTNPSVEKEDVGVLTEYLSRTLEEVRKGL